MASASADRPGAGVMAGSVEQVIARMRALGDAPSLYWNGRELTYAELLALVAEWNGHLERNGVGAGTVCAVIGDYSPAVCGLIFAAMQRGAILVPFTRAIISEVPKLQAIAGVEVMFDFQPDDSWSVTRPPQPQTNALVARFRERGSAGLIVFTSGSTGEPKGILHDCDRVLRKFLAPRPGWRTALFLLMDHFGGFNTLISTFAYGGTGVCLPDRGPEAVCRTVEAAKVTLLPATPTFLNLLVTSAAYRAFDLSSVRLITYGTEVMPETTLTRIREIFPNAEFKQTYGLSELGVLRSKSKDSESVWVKLGGEGFEVKVVDDVLWVRSEANMVGYLNAPNPFDDDGWLCTGDHVEVRGEYMRVLGRKTDMINVGGQKVFPAEVESVLTQAPNVADATVFGVKHPLLGHVVHARIALKEPEDDAALVARLRRFCLEHLAKHKVPMKFIVGEGTQYSQRFKKVRDA